MKNVSCDYDRLNDWKLNNLYEHLCAHMYERNLCYYHLYEHLLEGILWYQFYKKSAYERIYGKVARRPRSG